METTTHNIMVNYLDLPSWFNEAFYIFNYVISILQFFGFGINLIHFYILTRPHMRSNAIYRLMIGICSCDLLTQINTFLIFSPFWIRDSSNKDEQCQLTMTYFDAFLQLHGTTVLDITQRGASWMALFMALYRTLSVMFPLNPRIQKLSKPSWALWTILGVLVFTSLTTWMVQARRIIKEFDWDYE
uniref:G_PROTEIN_RECEP_F1_2 domain-containing protein n=1 Tax=Caenorhabditis tropicalis TaxID=1561998 RepID=A0A1I7TW03_9PELO